ncbi:hypothetical protein D3C81_1754840 [compost metagenome]
MRVGAVGELTEANAQLPGFVAAQLLDQHLDGRFVVQIFDFEVSAHKALGMAPTDPLAQCRYRADPRIGFLGLIRIKQVRDQIDPGRPGVLFEQFVKRADDGTAGKYFSTHGGIS